MDLTLVKILKVLDMEQNITLLYPTMPSWVQKNSRFIKLDKLVSAFIILQVQAIKLKLESQNYIMVISIASTLEEH